MIKYALQCSNGHGFNAWFPSSDGCDDQLAAGLVTCVACGDGHVRKSLMAPSITGSPKRQANAPGPVAESDTPVPDAAAPDAANQMALAGQMREALHMFRRYVEKNADYVGDKFAEEARKIHHGESEERGIYGETTPEEAEKLADEGVPFGSMPWIQDDT